jgi:hypothetical protein
MYFMRDDRLKNSHVELANKNFKDDLEEETDADSSSD